MIYTKTTFTYTRNGTETITDMLARIRAAFKTYTDGLWGNSLFTFTTVEGERYDTVWNVYQLPFASPSVVYLSVGITFDNVWWTTNRTLIVRFRPATIMPTAGNNLTNSILFEINIGSGPFDTSQYVIEAYASSSGFALTGSFNGGRLNPFVSFFRPQNKPAWFDEATFPYFCAYTGGNDGDAFSLQMLNNSNNTNPFLPLNRTLNFFYHHSQVNTITNLKHVVTSLPIGCPNNQGIFGRFPSNIGLTSASGIVRNQNITVGSQTYTVLGIGNNNRAALLRTA